MQHFGRILIRGERLWRTATATSSYNSFKSLLIVLLHLWISSYYTTSPYYYALNNLAIVGCMYYGAFARCSAHHRLCQMMI